MDEPCQRRRVIQKMNQIGRHPDNQNKTNTVNHDTSGIAFMKGCFSTRQAESKGLLDFKGGSRMASRMLLIAPVIGNQSKNGRRQAHARIVRRSNTENNRKAVNEANKTPMFILVVAMLHNRLVLLSDDASKR